MASEKGTLVRRSDIPVTSGGQTPETQRKWLAAQVPYRNFAGTSEVVDRKVEQWVTSHRERFHGRMGSTMQQWAVNWSAANGDSVWQEYEDDVHVPETKIALDAKVARIEEAIFEFDPLFACEGTRGDLPQWKSQIIQAAVHRSMDLARYRDYIQPCARDGELCNVSAIKIEWEQLVELRVHRQSELRFRTDGTPYRHDERWMREEVSKSGVAYRLVDPFLFLYDLDAGRPEDGAFIGDESDIFLHEIKSRVDSGFFSKKNYDKLVVQAGGLRTDGTTGSHVGARLADQLRMSRSVTTGQMFGLDEKGARGAKRCRAVEMWGWFDFEDGFDGVIDPIGRKVTGFQRVVATVVNGIVLRFMLNPFDRKFAPYAISRPNRNGHDAVAPSNFDTVVQINAQYDRAHSNILRWFDCAVSPKIVASTDSNLPDSILGDKPGTVYRGSGQWDLIKMPDLSSSVQYMHSHFRRGIEEASGALRVFESPQGTATETERKVQEQQRMVRTSIRAVAEQWRQVALMTYWMMAQFMTHPERFAVVGKAASVLGKSVEVTPDILQEDVDFRFLGLDSLHVFGNRQAGIAQYMGRWGPMLSQIPGLNLPAMARMDFELTVGSHAIQEIFPDPEPTWMVWSQDEENEMILAGREVPISKHDNDDEHIAAMVKIAAKIAKAPAYVQKRYHEHLEAHYESRDRKAAEAQAIEKQKQQLMIGQEGQAGVDRAPKGGEMQTDASSLAQTVGITPGPPQARTVSKTGREGKGTSQTQAMA